MTPIIELRKGRLPGGSQELYSCEIRGVGRGVYYYEHCEYLVRRGTLLIERRPRVSGGDDLCWCSCACVIIAIHDTTIDVEMPDGDVFRIAASLLPECELRSTDGLRRIDTIAAAIEWTSD